MFKSDFNCPPYIMVLMSWSLDFIFCRLPFADNRFGYSEAALEARARLKAFALLRVLDGGPLGPCDGVNLAPCGDGRSAAPSAQPAVWPTVLLSARLGRLCAKDAAAAGLTASVGCLLYPERSGSDSEGTAGGSAEATGTGCSGGNLNPPTQKFESAAKAESADRHEARLMWSLERAVADSLSAGGVLASEVLVVTPHDAEAGAARCVMAGAKVP